MQTYKELENKIDTLVRDCTSVVPRAKSEMRNRIKELLEAQRQWFLERFNQKIITDFIEETPKWLEEMEWVNIEAICMVCGMRPSEIQKLTEALADCRKVLESKS